LRHARIDAGWTQQGLANALGTLTATHSQIEPTQRKIDLLELRGYLAVIGVSVVDFVAQVHRDLNPTGDD
jgi:transcriptional regulator with XRE-family HTH domain